ncbi:hypothetical protein NL676_008676 [Syzygium grande]|nr:hypothetical protein NL676_008676 [Syzygium grande]
MNGCFWGSQWTATVEKRDTGSVHPKGSSRVICTCREAQMASNDIHRSRFSVSSYRDGRFGDRVRFVDRVLARYGMEKVQTFHLVLRSEYSDYPKIDSWLRFAINHQVEELLLDLKIEYNLISTWRVQWEGHIFSPWFYDCSSLTRLSLRGGRFSSSYCESVCWGSLKSLSIEGVSDEVLGKILLGSPVLEYLTLERPSGVEEIRSASLRELVIVADAMVSPINLWTPQLLSLHVRVDEYIEIIRIVEPPSLLDAQIDFTGPTESDFCQLKEMLCKLQNFTRILFGAWWCYQVMRPLNVEDVQVLLPNCKSLTLHVPITRFSFPAIANMLATTPNLEKLVIIVEPYDHYSGRFLDSDSENISDLDSCNVDKESYWRIKGQFKCWAKHLKNVEICFIFKYEEVFTLVKFLLEHALVLEDMVIKVMNESQHLEVVGSRKLHEVARRLQRYHRESKHAAVIINYLEEEHGKRQMKEHICIGHKDA